MHMLYEYDGQINKMGYLVGCMKIDGYGRWKNRCINGCIMWIWWIDYIYKVDGSSE